MTYDEGEHVKEVFAHFGLAYYLARAQRSRKATLIPD